MRKCPRCGQELKDYQFHCPNCGRSVPAQHINVYLIDAVISLIIIAVIAALIIFLPRSSKKSSDAALPAPSETVNSRHEENSTFSQAQSSTFTSTPAPSGPNINDIAGCDKRIVIPDDDSWLDDYETKYVKSKHGICIYLLWAPSKDSEHFDTIAEASEVTELARQGNYSLVIAPGLRIGWCKTALIVRQYY